MLTAAAAILGATVSLPFDTGKAAPGASEVVKELYKRSAANFDLNASLHLPNVRQATSARLSALDNLTASVNSPNMTIRFQRIARRHLTTSHRSRFRARRKKRHARTGEIIGRKDFLAFQTTPAAETAEIYPRYPQIHSRQCHEGGRFHHQF